MSVGATATILTFADSNVLPDSVAIYNAGTSTVYLGGSDVTTSAGQPLAAGASMSFDLSPGEDLYGIVSSGTVTVNVLATGV